MTISSDNRKAGPYICNGVTTEFPFAFKVFSATDVRVVLADATGAESDLVLGTHYAVALNADQDANPGGTVTTTAAYATGYTLTLTSGLQNLQPVTLTNNGGFYPTVINNALDRLTILVQQLAEQVSRAVKVSISSATAPDSLIASLLTAVSSALTYSNNASASATAAASSATAAASSATAAASSASAAAASVASSIAKTGTQSVTAVLQFPNNINQIMQADQYGTQQNLAYYDADNGFVIGGSDVRLSNLMSVPLNLFRQHHHFRFAQVSALDPRLAQTTTGGGSILLSANRLYLRTGTAASGDGVELRASNITVPIIAGQRVYFYLECPAANNFALEFGLNAASGSGVFAKFTRTDAASEGNIFCKVSNGGAGVILDTAQAVGTTRRLYCIEIVSPTVIKMYVSTTMGVLQLYATFTSPTDAIPASTCYPFIKLVSSGAAVNREALLSQFYFVLIE